MKPVLISAAIILFLINGATAQSPTDNSIREGNDHYKKQQYDQAAESYNKALGTDPSSATAKFNLANTLYKQAKPTDASKLFTQITGTATEKEMKANSYYNKGVVLTNQKKLEESIEVYKDALRINPEDKQARENLQKALLELKKKNPPQKQDEKENKKKQDQQKKQQPKMSPKETEQRLKLLEQKEQEVQERLQQEKSKTGAGQGKDW